MANYGRELRMGIDIRRRGKMKVTEFAEESGSSIKKDTRENETTG